MSTAYARYNAQLQHWREADFSSSVKRNKWVVLGAFLAALQQPMHAAALSMRVLLPIVLILYSDRGSCDAICAIGPDIAQHSLAFGGCRGEHWC